MEESALISRREFIRTGISATGLAVLAASPFAAWAKNESVKITILHTNDWHSRIEPFPKDAGANAGMGGAAVRAALIKKIRSEERNVLLLDAGDIFQGTPFFNFFQGELEYKLMSEMGYDCATLGNHDFDLGVEGLINQWQHKKFPFVNCNYDFTNTLLEGKINPYHIFKKDGIKIGVLGVGIELNGLVPNELFGNIKYNDPVSSANAIAQKLKSKEKCDLIICLSHIGYKYQNKKVSDIKLAEQSKNIDIIIGGHTHTFLDKPDVRKNVEGKEVIINQVGWAGIQLGRIDLWFNPAKGTINKGITTVVNIHPDNC